MSHEIVALIAAGLGFLAGFLITAGGYNWGNRSDEFLKDELIRRAVRRRIKEEEKAALEKHVDDSARGA